MRYNNYTLWIFNSVVGSAILVGGRAGLWARHWQIDCCNWEKSCYHWHKGLWLVFAIQHYFSSPFLHRYIKKLPPTILANAGTALLGNCFVHNEKLCESYFLHCRAVLFSSLGYLVLAFRNGLIEARKISGRGGIRTHAIEMTGALNQRLRPLGHPTICTLPTRSFLHGLSQVVNTILNTEVGELAGHIKAVTG